MKKKILFIINPISGGKSKHNFPADAERYLDQDKFEASFVSTQFQGHAFQLADEAVKNDIPIIVAVGGDGTINEVACAVEGSRALIGIVPCGSGNGLALSLGISLDHRKAIGQINMMRWKRIDSGAIGSMKFFNMAGIGFDANISHKFSQMSSRGFTGYIRTSLSEVLKYRSGKYEIEVDGKKIERTAFMISIANSPQYGNNAVVSPDARLDDGLLDVCIVRPFPLYSFPALVFRMFTKTAKNSRYLEIIKGKNIRIVSDNNETMVHLDGEPKEMGKEIFISVKPSSLSVLY